MKSNESRTARAGVRKGGRAALVCGLLLGGLPAAAWSAAAGTSTGTPIRLDIPAQPLAASLNALALQVNVQMVFEPDSVAGLRAPAVSGLMSVDDAMKALLAGTNLIFVHNGDGTVVVRRARARAPRPAANGPAPTVAAAIPATHVTEEFEGPLTLRAREVFRDPRTTRNLWLGDSWSTELGFDIRMDSHFAAEVAIGLPNDHALWSGPANASGFKSRIDALKISSQFLTFKYLFNPEGVFRPYLGAGINHTQIHEQENPVAALSRNEWSPAAQAGFDLTLGKHWLFNADLKYARVRPDVHWNGLSSGKMKADPLFIGVGLGYRFLGHRDVAVPTPPPPPAPPPPIVEAPPPPPPPPADSDHDGVVDPADRCPGTLAGLKVDADGCEIEAAVLTGVTFETDSAQLTAESSSVLDTVVAALVQRRGAKAQIHGYTDDRGQDAHNQTLSERRAAAVVEYLVRHGIAPDTLSSQGHGESEPVASNSTAEGRAQNRRVTVQFMRAVTK